jgi:hypothetical protein
LSVDFEGEGHLLLSGGAWRGEKHP